jgi:hypothetical protein
VIVYDLICGKKHRFEGWFKNSDVFKEQISKSMVNCPKCGGADVRMECAIGSVGRAKNEDLDNETMKRGLASASRKFIEQNFDDVGPEFTSEAIKIKYGNSRERNIRGSMTVSDEETLKKVSLPKTND